jgi:DamX protein
LNTNPEHYCFQLGVISNLDNIEHFLRKHILTGKVKVANILRGGQHYHYLLMGEFAERTAAADAIASLPESLRQIKPWPRTFGDLQSLGTATP